MPENTGSISDPGATFTGIEAGDRPLPSLASDKAGVRDVETQLTQAQYIRLLQSLPIAGSRSGEIVWTLDHQMAWVWRDDIRIWVPLGDAAVIKKADEPRTSTTTLTNDTELKITVPANTTWSLEFELLFDDPAAVKALVDVYAPTGSSGSWLGIFNSGTGATVTWFALSSTGGSIQISTLAGHRSIIRAYVVVGSTAGDIGLRWAQGTANATATKVLKGSRLLYRGII